MRITTIIVLYNAAEPIVEAILFNSQNWIVATFHIWFNSISLSYPSTIIQLIWSINEWFELCRHRLLWYISMKIE